jgi:predicted MPP superfamily phosphohydrolase
MTNALDADLVCFTGDLVNLSADELTPYISELSRIKARDGIVSVLGNHDFMLYGFSNRGEQEREEAVARLVDMQRNRLGWQVLRNENIEIWRGEHKITIVGVDNKSCTGQGFHTISKGDLPKALMGCDGFRILLSHDPSHWATEVLNDTDIPLTLSGHTHAAQLRLFGWTPASWVFRYTAGRYDEGEQTLHINIGLGCTAPFRLGANPEISLITLRHQ